MLLNYPESELNFTRQEHGYFFLLLKDHPRKWHDKMFPDAVIGVWLKLNFTHIEQKRIQ